MHKKTAYSGNYSKRSSKGGKKGNAGLGSLQPPVQSDANQIAAPNNNSYPKHGGKNSRPSMRR